MLGTARGLLVAAIIGTLGHAGRGAAQWTPAAPVPISPPITLSDAGPGPIISRPVPVVTQPVPVPSPPTFAPQPYYPPPAPLGPAPTSYGASAPEPLLFFNWELQFVQPSVSNHLNNTITFPDGTTKTIALPGVGLDFTVAPKIELGWRLPDRLGEFSFGYRFLIAEGKQTQTADGIETNSRSRFNFNELDFDYATARSEFEPHWWFQARIGARVDWSFYDTRANTPALLTVDRESNYFVGAGPHLGLDVERTFVMGFGVFGTVDGAVLIGQPEQRFVETIDGVSFTTQPQRTTLAVPTIQAQIGVSYTPPSFERLRFRVGYQYERWFNLGSVQGSSLDFSSQGGFLRGEIDF